MTFDRKVFFERVRGKPFGGTLTQAQVDGLNALLDADEKYGAETSIPQFSYMLATAHLETGATMQPIKEYGGTAYFTRMYDIKGERPAKAKELGNLQSGDGAKYCGRGYVQLTGRTNYARATKELRAMGFDVDLVAKPDDAMRPDVAAAILFAGMEQGWFTGKTLDQTIDDLVDGDERADFIQARRIINGTDRAAAIADTAEQFLSALLLANVEGPPPVEDLKPVPAPADRLGPEPLQPNPDTGGQQLVALVVAAAGALVALALAMGADLSSIREMLP
jgi:putative chitinase